MFTLPCLAYSRLSCLYQKSPSPPFNRHTGLIRLIRSCIHLQLQPITLCLFPGNGSISEARHDKIHFLHPGNQTLQIVSLTASSLGKGKGGGSACVWFQGLFYLYHDFREVFLPLFLSLPSVLSCFHSSARPVPDCQLLNPPTLSKHAKDCVQRVSQSAGGFGLSRGGTLFRDLSTANAPRVSL